MANSYLTHTQTADSSNTKFTFSFWMKRSSISASQCIYATQSGSDEARIEINSSDELFLYKYNGSFQWKLQTNRKFRDIFAWYHIVLKYDSTQSTSSDRLKLYVNGVEETSFASSTYPGSSENSNFFQGAVAYIGCSENTAAFFDGYLSHVAMTHGYAYAPTTFGETDSTSGIWKFKSPSGVTWGTQGYHLKFENSGALGTDSSGQSNTFAVNGNLKQALDTPSNVYCAWNPLYPAGMTFANGNTKLTQGSAWKSMGGTLAVSSGKWYWEIKNSGNYAYLGFADIKLFNEGCATRESFTVNAATTGTAYSMLSSSGTLNSVAASGSQNQKTYTGATYGNDIIGIALNLDDNEATWYKNGTALNSGTPLSIDAGTYIPAASLYGNSCEANFGNGFFGTTAITSAGSNGNGSLFEYDVPSGYYALNTKNINTYG